MASTMKCVVLGLGLLFLATSVTSESDVNGTTDEEILAERYWRRTAYLGDDVILPCLIVEEFGYDPHEIVWLTPKGHPILSKNDNKVVLPDQNASLQIRDIQEDDFGWYHCGILDDDIGDDYGLYKNISKALLAAVKTGDELKEQYNNMATVGGIAAAICCGLFTGSSIVYLWCFSKAEEEADDAGTEMSPHSDAENNIVNDSGKPVRAPIYDNPGFEKDINETATDGKLGEPSKYEDTITTSF